MKENVGVSETTDRSVGDLAEKVSPSKTNSISPSSAGLFSFSSENVSKTGAAGGGGGGGATITGSEVLPDPPPQALSAIRHAKIADDPNSLMFFTISPIES